MFGPVEPASESEAEVTLRAAMPHVVQAAQEPLHAFERSRVRR
jgi:hypothetical protein